MKKQSKKELKKKRLNQIYIVLIIVLIILLLGWFWKTELEDKEVVEENCNTVSEKERLLIEFKIITEKINFYYQNEELYKRKKTRFFFYARLIIGLVIVGINYIYYLIFKEYNLNTILSVNQLLVFSYSFLAFITYGTLDNFSNEMKSKLIYFLHKNEIYFTIEITNLNSKIKLITKKLSALESLSSQIIK